jgi:hypothetical protein
MTFGKSASMKLKEAVDDFLDLDSDPSRYLMNYRGGERGGRVERTVEPRTEKSEHTQKSNEKPQDKTGGGRIRRVFRKI